ncbi:MAG: HU family DNA-binding protein [Proteobacteria bacterium]|nr:HU family DNA-binding protein [Pseudomonadota bacterium]
MNKRGLVDLVAELSGLSKANSGQVLESMIQVIQEGLKAEKTIRLSGFGIFSILHRSAREGHNPRTGKKIKIPAMKHPKFKPGKALKGNIS